MKLPIHQLVPRQDQPRRFFDPNGLRDLAESIRRLGILEPILVRPLADGRYEIVAGERRYRAAQMVGLTEVPAVLYEGPPAPASLAENTARRDLAPAEVVQGVLEELLARGISREEAVRGILELRSLRKSRHRERERAAFEGHPLRPVLQEILATAGVSLSNFLEALAPLLRLDPEELRVYAAAGYSLAQIRRLEQDPELKSRILQGFRQAEATFQEFPVLPPGLAVRTLPRGRVRRSPEERFQKALEQSARTLERLVRVAGKMADRGDEEAAAIEEAAEELLQKVRRRLAIEAARREEKEVCSLSSS